MRHKVGNLWVDEGPVIRGNFPHAALPGQGSDGSGGWQSPAHRAVTGRRTRSSEAPRRVWRTHPDEVQEYIPLPLPPRRSSRALDDRTCPQCGAVYHPKNHTQTYCSSPCSQQSRKKPVVVRERRPYRASPTCHPERRNYARQMCESCYNKAIRPSYQSRMEKKEVLHMTCGDCGEALTIRYSARFYHRCRS